MKEHGRESATYSCANNGQVVKILKTKIPIAAAVIMGVVLWRYSLHLAEPARMRENGRARRGERELKAAVHYWKLSQL